MSFLSKLVLGSTEYNVLAADYEVTQTIDAQGRPNGKPKAGVIRLTIESSSNNDIIQWAADDKMTKEGKVVFYRRDTASSMKTIGFKDAHCYYLQETFDAASSEPMKMHLHISAGSVDLNGAAQLAHPWSAISKLVTDVANTLGLGNMLGDGGGGGMSDSPMSSPEMKQMEDTATDAYNSGSQAASTAQRVKQEAEDAKDQSKAAAGEAGEEAKNAGHEAESAAKGIPSFKPF